VSLRNNARLETLEAATFCFVEGNVKIAPLILILVFAMAAASCANTVRGVKTDVQSTANAAAS
jgi:predicted small secreted protein